MVSNEEQEKEEVLLLNLWASPFAMSCAIALNLKGVPFSYVDEDIPYHKSELLLHSNPVYKEVPVLIHNGKPVAQSLVILEYIEEAWPSSVAAGGSHTTTDRAALLPGGPRLNALARFWAQFGNFKFIETGLKLMKKVGEEHEAARREIVEQFCCFEKGLAETALEAGGKGSFFFGKDCPTLPDIVMASFVCWKETYESLGGFTFPGPDQCPLMHRWLIAMSHLSCVLPAVPDKTRLLTHCTLFREAVLRAASTKQ